MSLKSPYERPIDAKAGASPSSCRDRWRRLDLGLSDGPTRGVALLDLVAGARNHRAMNSSVLDCIHQTP